MRCLRLLAPSLLAMSALTSSLQAHFIFAVTEPANHPQAVKVYFGELAEPDDPELLSKIENAKAFAVSGRNKLEPLTLKKDGAALVGDLAAAKQTSSPVVLNHTYGVMGKGGAPFLLKYYAKAYAGTLPGNWSKINNKEELPLEIVPELKDGKIDFIVYWEGKPTPGAQVTIESPVLEDKIQGDTNDKGIFSATLPKAGLYSVRARHTEEKSGEHDGKAYQSIKHYSTLSLNHTPATITAQTHQWPDLEKGTTSFGGAVIGDDLYVYGGNYGGGHEYSEEEQSGDFIRLNLKTGKAWEKLPGGPKLTGLAMAAHGGKLYRVGGFKVEDVEGKDATLTSQPSFARFDPAKGAWEELAPLPEGRSSHDIAVVGDRLYVIGGWSMAKSDNKNDKGWLTSVYSTDLTAEKPEWKKETDAPFERRALSTAAYNGKVYVIGGMQKTDGIANDVNIYDPATQKWSTGPKILGTGMDGFGTAAFTVNGRLIVTTMSGSIQALSADGSHWEHLGQMTHPRFFHETAPWQNGLVIFGGTSMENGKAIELEYFPIGNNASAPAKAVSQK